MGIISDDIINIGDEQLCWEILRDSTVLVTGANGALASYMVFTLLYRNEKYGDNVKIIALCRSYEKAVRIYGEVLGQKNFVLLIQDVCDEIANEYRADYIIHAASPANFALHKAFPYQIIEANVIGYHNLLKKSDEWRSRKILLFSSAMVYGDMVSETIDENYRSAVNFANMKNGYCLAKQMAEMMSILYSFEHKTSISIARPYGVYGPGGRYSEKKAFTDFLKNFLLSEDIILKSSGTQYRQYIYIRDAVKAFFYILLNGKSGEAYNVTSTENYYMIREMAHFFCQYTDKIHVRYENEIDEFAEGEKGFVIDNRKLKSLGWEEETSLKEGIFKTICWAQSADFLEV